MDKVVLAAQAMRAEMQTKVRGFLAPDLHMVRMEVMVVRVVLAAPEVRVAQPVTFSLRKKNLAMFVYMETQCCLALRENKVKAVRAVKVEQAAAVVPEVRVMKQYLVVDIVAKNVLAVVMVETVVLVALEERAAMDILQETVVLPVVLE